MENQTTALLDITPLASRRQQAILDDGAVQLIAHLERVFGPRRRALLEQRAERQRNAGNLEKRKARADAGELKSHGSEHA